MQMTCNAVTPHVMHYLTLNRVRFSNKIVSSQLYPVPDPVVPGTIGRKKTSCFFIHIAQLCLLLKSSKLVCIYQTYVFGLPQRFKGLTKDAKNNYSKISIFVPIVPGLPINSCNKIKPYGNFCTSFNIIDRRRQHI